MSSPSINRHEQLVTLLAERSAQTGHFILASGRESNLYIDARLTTMSPDGLTCIGPLALERMSDAGWGMNSIGGLTLGADPVSYAIAYASQSTTNPLRAFTVRKEPKTHGTGKVIEGPFLSGDRVAVIEDVITTGGSALRAAAAVEAAGGTVVGVLAVVDREEGGRESIIERGYPVISLALASEVLGRMRTG